MQFSVGRRQYLGGEKLFPISLLFSKPRYSIFDYLRSEFKEYHINYTFGAHASLLAIIDDLNFKPNQVILLPSYICHSILKSFQFRSIPYCFYEVDKNLIIDVKSIQRSLSDNTRAILVIDYFGVFQNDVLKEYLKQLQVKGIRVIQDCVQSIRPHLKNAYGDYLINSFRKIAGVEGGYIISKQKMEIKYASSSNIQFLLKKRIGQFFRFIHLWTGLIGSNTFRLKFRQSEEVYYDANVYKLTALNSHFIARYDFEKIESHYTELYNKLLAKFKASVPSGLRRSESSPFAFCIWLNNRERAREVLAGYSIYCPIHWHLPSEISRVEFQDSWFLSEHCITIPFSFPSTFQVDLLIEKLDEILLSDIKTSK